MAEENNLEFEKLKRILERKGLKMNAPEIENYKDMTMKEYLAAVEANADKVNGMVEENTRETEEKKERVIGISELEKHPIPVAPDDPMVKEIHDRLKYTNAATPVVKAGYGIKELHKRKHLPSYWKATTKQFSVFVEGIKYPVTEGLRAYGLAKRQRGFVEIDGRLYELPSDWTGKIAK